MHRIEWGRKSHWLLGALTTAAFLILVIVLLTRTRAETSSHSSPACLNCIIEEHIVQLGATDGPGALPGEPSSIIVDSSGRYWTLFYGQTMPLVFGADGQLIRELGRRGGGPGEFDMPKWAVELPGDSVLILDRLGGRATVFDRELHPVRSVRIQVGERVSDAEGHFWPKLLVSSVFRTPERVGWPLHAFDMSQDEAVPLEAFGFEEADIRSPSDLRRVESHIVASPRGSLWVVDRLRYRMSEWTPDGELLRAHERSPAWFPEVSDGLFGSRNEPPPPRIVGANMDSQGRLWIYILRAAPTWREAWAAVPRSEGRTHMPVSAMPESGKLFQTAVEVIDPRTGQLIANRLTEHRIIAALPRPGLVAAYTLDADGVPTVSVLQFTLVQQ